MSDDRHLDGNAVGGLLIEVFGREMTSARGCCDGCGAINPLGAVLAFTEAPGVVLGARLPVGAGGRSSNRERGEGQLRQTSLDGAVGLRRQRQAADGGQSGDFRTVGSERSVGPIG